MTTVIGALLRAAPFRDSTWNDTDWTVEVVLSAGSAVQRQDARGAFAEVLSLAGATFPASIPLLDSHRRTSLDDRLGDVTNIRREGDLLVGTAKLSKHSVRAQRIAAEIKDGAKFGASIGYTVPPKAWTEIGQGAARTKTATTFDIHELSLVVVPADTIATIRSEPELTNTITREQRIANNIEIRAIASRAGLGAVWADKHIDEETDIAAVRTAALAEMADRSSTAATVRSVHNEHTRDNPEVRIKAIGEAMFARTAAGHTPSDLAREFANHTVRDIALDCLQRSGIQVTGLSTSDIIERGLMTTSDFPAIFQDTANRAVRAAYEAAPSGIRQLAKPSTAKDFRAKTSVGLANNFKLEKVNQHGEFKRGSFVASSESYSIDTFGKIVGLTRQMLINDDIGIFGDEAGRLGQAAAAFEADFLYNKIAANPLMADGKNVFSAEHNNLATAAPLSVASLSASRIKLRGQTDAGANLIAITPKYLVVGPVLETTAEQVLTETAAATVDTVNPFAGKLTLVVEPRMTGNQWYLAADPAQVVSLEYSFLAGQPGPVVTSQLGFSIDGVEYKIREDFGAGWLDFRGWVKNAGA